MSSEDFNNHEEQRRLSHPVEETNLQQQEQSQQEAAPSAQEEQHLSLPPRIVPLAPISQHIVPPFVVARVPTSGHLSFLLPASAGFRTKVAHPRTTVSNNTFEEGAEFLLGQPIPKRARLHQQPNPSQQQLTTDPIQSGSSSNNNRNFNFITSILTTMAEKHQSGSNSPQEDKKPATARPLPKSTFPNPENKPSPRDFAEFIENPRSFHPTFEFIQSTFVEEESILTQCIKIQNVPAVEVLLQCGADANLLSKKGVAPISVAAHKGNVAIMKLLIDHGAVVNAVNSSGSTALIQAAHFGHLEAVKLLLAHNANADFANVKGTTALMRASQEGHVEISRVLLSAGVDVNRRNHEGMNALMLASQRGHSEIVLLLIKANAVMDEQTAQGSTALMLACKRGHEKCVEVLVTMGAEIFIRDRRFRTARDTAMKRNHTGLLVWLDTQVQVRKIQELKHKQRSQVLAELRKASIQQKLRLVDNECQIHNLLEASRALTNNREHPDAYPLSEERIVKNEAMLKEFEDRTSGGSLIASSSPQEAVALINNSFSRTFYEQTVNSVPIFPTGCVPAKRISNYAEWHWVSLLHRCMSLPDGVFELVMEMLPLPRIWHWSLDRLARRCKLAPHQAMLDMSVIMDEILTDSQIVHGKNQSNQLIKLSRSPHLMPCLTEIHGMSAPLLDIINSWADVQNLLQRVNESEITYKWPFARRMLTDTVAMYRWYRHRSSAQKTLRIIGSCHAEVATGHATSRCNGMSGAKRAGLVDTDDLELLEVTDAGGEEASDIEHDIAIAEQENDHDIGPGGNDTAVGDSDDESVGAGHHNNQNNQAQAIVLGGGNA